MFRVLLLSGIKNRHIHWFASLSSSPICRNISTINRTQKASSRQLLRGGRLQEEDGKSQTTMRESTEDKGGDPLKTCVRTGRICRNTGHAHRGAPSWAAEATPAHTGPWKALQGLSKAHTKCQNDHSQSRMKAISPQKGKWLSYFKAYTFALTLHYLCSCNTTQSKEGRRMV